MISTFLPTWTYGTTKHPTVRTSRFEEAPAGSMLSNCGLMTAQLTCVGKPCQVFEPEVVQCTNMGDDGLGNIQWRVSWAGRYAVCGVDEQCDTDLPSSLRLGKVEVSCEGWQAAGDKNVLQGELPRLGALCSSCQLLRTGSCGLTYNLHQTNADISEPGFPSSKAPIGISHLV